VSATTAPLPARLPAVDQVWAVLRRRLELVLLAALAVSFLLLPKASAGVAGVGLVVGAGYALQALGLVLIVRSSRIINFAQVQLGAVTGLLFFELWQHSEFVVLGNMACGGCFKGMGTDMVYLQSHPNQVLALLLAQHHDGWLAFNFWLSAAISLALAPLVSWIVYRLVIRRFEQASRLIATVVTLALAEVLVGAANALPSLFDSPNNQVLALHLPLPQVNISVAPAVFHLPEVLTVAVVVLVTAGLAAFLRLHRVGAGMRAVADNPRRALTLGIKASRLSAVSWMLAGTLSGLAAILLVMDIGEPGVNSGQNAFNVPQLVTILAALCFARLTSLPVALVASLVLGVGGALFFQGFNGDVPFDITLLLLIGLALMLQVARQSRAEREADAGQLVSRESRPIPRELRHIASVERVTRWLSIGVVLVVLGYPFVMSPEQVSLGSVVLIYTIIGLSLLVLTGWAGQISLGQFAFAGIGGYVATLLAAKLGLFILVALPIGGIAGALAAMVVGIPALRLRGLNLAITTLALAFATSAVLLNPSYLGQFLPAQLARPQLLGFSLDDQRAFFYVILVFLLLTFFAIAGLRRSRTGRTLIACRDNEQASQSFGINLFRARLEAFAISGFIAAFAGGLLAYQQHGVQPASFNPILNFTVFLIVVIGGLGTVVGPLLGSVYYGVLLLVANPVVQLLGSGLGVLAVLLLFPSGLGGIAYQARDAWLRRVAVRHRVRVPSLLADSSVDPLEAEAPIAPKLRAGGSPVFVPRRYELTGQWAAED
jgi:branched-chain amino acid transport system permease protein